jgi:polyisoprenoid-binding protein YceI
MSYKKIVVAAALTLAIASGASAQSWDLDAAHSSVGFSVRHMVISKTTGKFNEFSGAVKFDGKNFAAGSVEITVQIASIDTDNEKRDDHLRSPEFFDAEKFATMNFKSKKVTAGEGNEFTIVGDLTIKGVTKEVEFAAEFNGAVDDPWGNSRAGFSAATEINRQDFGLTWSKTLEAGGLIVGDKVGITLEIEVVKSKG